MNLKQTKKSATSCGSAGLPGYNAVRTEVIGDCTLYQGDCAVILPQMPDFDLVLTDPPYGIGESKKASKRTASFKGNAKWKNGGPTDYEYSEWDNSKPPFWLFLLMADKSKNAIFWGGNYFNLPESSCWFVWDKENGGSDFADCELAWTNFNKAVRLFKYLWNGFQKAIPEKRYHATQKPLALMEWCLSHAPDAKTVCDPFMGSGTTGVACARKGLQFTGIEREEKYFDIACKRIDEAYRTRPRLFDVVKKEVAKPMNLF